MWCSSPEAALMKIFCYLVIALWPLLLLLAVSVQAQVTTTVPPTVSLPVPQGQEGLSAGIEFPSNNSNPTNQTNIICPPGFFCSRDDQIPCEVLKLLPVLAGLGNVHAGLYCPGSLDRTQDNGYQNCPIGFHCPNATTVLACPAGYFCPHKTQTPAILCKRCGEGATSLQRAIYGYIVIGVAFGLVLVFMIWVRNNKRVVARLENFHGMSLGTVRDVMTYRQRQQKLQKLKPKLKVIEKRLVKGGTNNKISSSKGGLGLRTERADGTIRFNARKLFDTLDEDGNGELSFKELNRVLKLKPVALRQFMHRMNQAAREPDGTDTVSRPVFAKYFLVALQASSNFEPTRQEAAQLFDEISERAGPTYHAKGEVPHELFFKSPLGEFLTDGQINDLLKRLHQFQQMEGDTESFAGGGFANLSARQRFTIAPRRPRRVVQRNDFIAWYPQLLMEITDTKEVKKPIEGSADKGGIDMSFEKLCLSVQVKNSSIKVVNNVTGRLRSGTMTALMGGSGAGKTSLLNALCGRAFYGEVTGTIKINGHVSSIEEHASCVGFVPQDDVVYAELTVRENFIFAGKFQLPAGTPVEEIEDLADETMAGLGLSRVMHSIVGDVNRRGVSGGEKKRVNIGLELMSRPKLLYLDEPTSGLDASSALLVMSSLRNLVEQQGVTICSVIHQPRKFIFELFDSLILLGVGGHVVYNGKVNQVRQYFTKLNYQLPPGESIADWLIDISSGRLEPNIHDERRSKNKRKALGATDDKESDLLSEDEADSPAALASTSADIERTRRDILYSRWNEYFKSVPRNKRSQYEAPEPFDLPPPRTKPSFFKQLGYQVHRLVILASRNWYTKLVDTVIIVGAVILISLMDGLVQPTLKEDLSNLDYYRLAEPFPPQAMVREFPKLFQYAILANGKIVSYCLKIGVIVAVLVGLTATKVLTEKRNEFFRESGSSYDVNAYFAAVNIVSTVEHSIQVIFSSMFALWLRNSLAVWYSYYIHFLLLAWTCVSWALLFPLLVPPKNVVLVTGFYMTFFSLLFSGGIDPIKYRDIYKSVPTALFSGLFSPTRFFIEALAVAESRCLPSQSGFTDLGPNLLASDEAVKVASFQIVGQGLDDFDTVIQTSCRGWYWGCISALFVGLTIRWVSAGVIHVSGRAQQAKKPLKETLAKNPYSIAALLLYLYVLLMLLFASVCSLSFRVLF